MMELTTIVEVIEVERGMLPFNVGERVVHPKYGKAVVEVNEPDFALVIFDNGFEDIDEMVLNELEELN